MYSSNFYKILSIISSVVLVAFVTVPRMEVAYADPLIDGSVTDTLSTVKTGVAANHTIQFQLSASGGGVAAAETIVITPNSFTGVGSIAFGDVDVCHNVTSFATCSGGGTELTLAASASAGTWGVSVGGGAITITSDTGTIPASSYVVVEIGTHAAGPGVNQLTNPAAGSYLVDVNAGGDVGSAVVTIVTDDVVAVTATVNAGDTLTFSISDNTIEFGALSFLAAKYADNSAGSATLAEAHTLSVASSGAYAVTVKGATLTKGGDNIDPADTPGGESSTPGTEQFGISIDINSGANGVVDTDYDGGTFYFGANATTTDSIATCASTCTEDVYGATYLANIAVGTVSGSYSTNLTYVATGTF